MIADDQRAGSADAGDAGAREAHVEAARRRLNELNRELRIQLPVYVMVTKCDLVAGFTEYFDDLTQEGRAQVWGMTFPYEQTRRRRGAANVYPAEFDALMARSERAGVRRGSKRARTRGAARRCLRSRSRWRRCAIR